MWGKEQSIAFKTLQRMMVDTPVLAHKPIAYFSQKLSELEMKKGMPERELLGLTEAMLYFRPYIFACPTTCYVDQKSLLWILKQERLNKFLKYRIRLEEFNYELKYIPGEKNRSD